MERSRIGASGRRLPVFLTTAALVSCAVYDDSLLELGRGGTAAGSPAIVTSSDGRGGAGLALGPTTGSGGSLMTTGGASTESESGTMDETPDAAGDGPRSMDEVTSYTDAAPPVEDASDAALLP